MTTQDELKNFVEENTIEVITRKLSECRLENARLCKQVSTLRKVLRRMDWLEAGDEVSGSDVIAMREALEATA